MTYNSFMYLVRTLSYHIRIHNTSMRKRELLMQYGLAKNRSQADDIRSILKNYYEHNCTLNHIILAIIYIHYRYTNMWFENAKGTKATLPYIMEEYGPKFEDKKVFHIRDGVFALQRFFFNV